MNHGSVARAKGSFMYICLNFVHVCTCVSIFQVARNPNQPSPRSLFHPSICLFLADMVAKCSDFSYAVMQIISKLGNDMKRYETLDFSPSDAKVNGNTHLDRSAIKLPLDGNTWQYFRSPHGFPQYCSFILLHATVSSFQWSSAALQDW